MPRHAAHPAPAVNVLREVTRGQYTVQVYDYADLYQDFPHLAKKRHWIVYRVLVQDGGKLYPTIDFPEYISVIGSKIAREIHVERQRKGA